MFRKRFFREAEMRETLSGTKKGGGVLLEVIRKSSIESEGGRRRGEGCLQWV